MNVQPIQFKSSNLFVANGQTSGDCPSNNKVAGYTENYCSKVPANHYINTFKTNQNFSTINFEGFIAKNVTELVGNTPLVYLDKLNKDGLARVALKLESFNPGHSVKDRIALAMIETAEKAGKISPDKTTLIEPTSGNTGIGLAMIAAAKGYKLIITMPETMSIERRMLMKFYGADIVLTPGKLGMKGAIEEANALASKIENSHILQQFKNPANPEIHFKTTAEEIWNDTDGKIDMIVSGVGTGGSITGIAKNLKGKNPNFKVIAVEPAESPVLSGGAPSPHKIQGIGAGFVPDVLDKSLLDGISTVTSEQAIQTSRELAQKEDILAGISSGAAVHAALQEAKKAENAGKLIVAIAPDTGERYISTALFDHVRQ